MNRLRPGCRSPRPSRAPADGVLPDVAVDVTYRIARHAGTITGSVADAVISRLGESPVGGLRYVELCSVVSATAAVVSFHRNVGLPIPEFPAAVDGEPTRERPEEIAGAELNWVPVAAPADVQPAVLQAYSAVPGAHTMTWRLASAQYIAPEEMVHAGWMRRSDGLTRAETELVAARVAQLRECFY